MTVSGEEEQPIAACSYLLFKIEELVSVGAEIVDIGQLNFAICDIGTKAQRLEPLFKRRIFDSVERALFSVRTEPVIDQAVKWLGTHLIGDDVSKEFVKPRADVAIVTVINEERKAVRKVFGADNRRPAFEINGRDFFSASLLKPSAKKKSINLYITMVGEPRNVPCVNVCRDIIEKLDVDLLILCGIAGGNRDQRIALTHVVAPYNIYYVEGGKRHTYTRFLRGLYGRFGARIDLSLHWLGNLLGRIRITDPETVCKDMSDPIKAYLQNFEPQKAEALKLCQVALSKYSPDEIPSIADTTLSDFVLHRTDVMCGEKILVDDSLRTTTETVSRNIYAVDMESYGFVAACEHSHKPWVVFRGLSDYADPKKDDSRHIAASVAAAVTARLFLQHTYKLPEDRNEF